MSRRLGGAGNRGVALLLCAAALAATAARGKLSACDLFGDEDPSACAGGGGGGGDAAAGAARFAWGQDDAWPDECATDDALAAFAERVAAHAAARRPPGDVAVTRAARWRAAVEARDATDGSPRGETLDWTPVAAADAALFSSTPGRCPLERREAAALTAATFAADFEGPALPFILTGLGAADDPDAAAFGRLRSVLRRAVLLYCFGHVPIELRQTLFPSVGQRARNNFRTPFGRYASEWMRRRTLGEKNSAGRYLFADYDAGMDPRWERLLRLHPGPKRFLHHQGSTGTGTATATGHDRDDGGDEGPLHLSLGVGAPNTGVPFHAHRAVWAQQLFGAKRWLLAPPGPRPPNATRERTSLQWATDVLPALPDGKFQAVVATATVPASSIGPAVAPTTATVEVPVYDCTVGPGEALYLPDQWHHATVNLGDAVVLSTFHATAPGSCGVPWLRRETPPE